MFHFLIPSVIVKVETPILSLFNKRTHQKPILNENQKRISIKSFDGTHIISTITYADSTNLKGTILLLHGIRSNKEAYLSLANKLSSRGYNSIAIDSRGHGESDGDYCTFGVKERKDISCILDSIIHKEQLNNIGIWGQSLGGAIALQAMASDKRIQFGVIESTFSDFEKITRDYFEYLLGFRNDFLIDYFTQRAANIAGFETKDAAPKNLNKMISQPVLLVHGDSDKRININYATENLNSISSKAKQLLVIPKAGHLNVWKIGADEYFEKVFGFIDSCIKDSGVQGV